MRRIQLIFAALAIATMTFGAMSGQAMAQDLDCRDAKGDLIRCDGDLYSPYAEYDDNDFFYGNDYFDNDYYFSPYYLSPYAYYGYEDSEEYFDYLEDELDELEDLYEDYDHYYGW